MDSNRDNPHKQRWPDSKSSTHINPYPSIHSGWWYTYPSEKYESQLGLLFPIYGKIKKVPNHQPAFLLSAGFRTKSLSASCFMFLSVMSPLQQRASQCIAPYMVGGFNPHPENIDRLLGTIFLDRKGQQYTIGIQWGVSQHCRIPKQWRFPLEI